MCCCVACLSFSFAFDQWSFDFRQHIFVLHLLLRRSHALINAVRTAQGHLIVRLLLTTIYCTKLGIIFLEQLNQILKVLSGRFVMRFCDNLRQLSVLLKNVVRFLSLINRLSFILCKNWWLYESFATRRQGVVHACFKFAITRTCYDDN